MKQSWLHGVLAAALVVACGATAGTTPTAQDTWKPEPGYTSLFNGKDLTGWRYYKEKDLTGKLETYDKRFEVKDGIIVANAKDRDGKGGIKDLYTVKDYNKEFHLKLEFRAAPKADSGVYLRGPQLQVRDFIRRNEMKHLKKFKNDDWNELDITVKNGVVKTTVNNKMVGAGDLLELTVKDGKPAARLNGKDVAVTDLKISVGAVAKCLCNGEIMDKAMNAGTKGGIGLQAETGKFEFRHIQVKEMP